MPASSASSASRTDATCPTVKAQAAARAVGDGAREIDMVIDIGALRSGREDTVAADVEAVVRAIPGMPVKVISRRSARRCAEAPRVPHCRCGRRGIRQDVDGIPRERRRDRSRRPADARNSGANVGVKASGGIRTLADAMAMIDAGASRIGTSASAAILAAMG